MKTFRLILWAAAVSLAGLVPSYAQPAAPAIQSIQNDLRGLGFGAGVAAIFTDGDAPVENASVDAGGILRVDRQSRARVGAILEAHFLFNDLQYTQQAPTPTQRKALDALAAVPNPGAITVGSVANDTAHGPMVTVELGDDVIRTIGLGYMVSWRRFDVTRDANGRLATITPRGVAFNLGVSVLIEPKVKNLADGLVENALPPAGMEVRFQEEARVGCALVFSAGF